MFTWGMTHRRVRSNNLPLAKLKSQILKKNTFFVIFQCAKKMWDFREYKHSQKKSFGESKVMSCMVDLGFSLSLSCCSEAGVAVMRYDLKTCTALTTYCLQIGHSFILLPHLVQVTMWPHSRRTQSIVASMQILQRLSSWIVSGPFSPSARQRHREVTGNVFGVFLNSRKQWYCISCTVEGQDGSTSSYPSYLGKVMLTIFSKMSMPVTVECQDVSMTTTQSLSLEECW